MEQHIELRFIVVTRYDEIVVVHAAGVAAGGDLHRGETPRCRDGHREIVARKIKIADVVIGAGAHRRHIERRGRGQTARAGLRSGRCRAGGRRSAGRVCRRRRGVGFAVAGRGGRAGLAVRLALSHRGLYEPERLFRALSGAPVLGAVMGKQEQCGDHQHCSRCQ